nr:hypothetical protein [Tanacetum cinerariifolium]
NSKAYKEYYACAMGEAAPKPKASARKKKEEELAKSDEEDKESGKGGDEVRESEGESDE